MECLIRIINSSKLFQEEYCFKIAQVGAPQAIHELINAINRNSEAMRVFYLEISIQYFLAHNAICWFIGNFSC